MSADEEKRTFAAFSEGTAPVKIRYARMAIKRLESDPVADFVLSRAIHNIFSIAKWEAILRGLGEEP